jgi:hypothetical protein
MTALIENEQLTLLHVETAALPIPPLTGPFCSTP